MNEHFKLKAICDLIGYSSKFDYGDLNYCGEHPFFGKYNKGDGMHYMVNVREIIFTQEFMKKLENYRIELYGLDEFPERDTKKSGFMGIWKKLLKHLDDPVSYLHNLLLGNN